MNTNPHARTNAAARRCMKSILSFVFAITTVMGMAPNPAAANYCWSVSHSSQDPLVNTGLPNAGVDNLFLWLFGSDQGMAAAEMSLDSLPPGQVLAFNVMNGFLNAGDATHLLLAVGGCPGAPIISGSILILHFAPLSLCLGGANVTVDCTINPQAWPNTWIGYADLGLPPCSGGRHECGGFSVEGMSWGRIKSIYR
jgi:hypothetical protein